MPDSKITALTALTAADPAVDMFPVVDVSDTTMAASGTTKRISINNILACSPSATLASATITGDLTVDTSTLKVDSANDYVGIGTASPVQSLTISGEASVRVNDLIYWNGYYNAGFKARAAGYAAFIGEAASGDFTIANTSASAAGAGSALTFFDRYRISNSGVHTWEYVGGVAGTAMTLNATGLGVGVAPSASKLQVAGNIGLPNSCTASGETSGVFSIDVANLLALSGGNWRQASILLVYSGVNTDLSNSIVLQTVVTLTGLATWNTISKNDIVGTASVAVSNDTTTGARITVTVPVGNSGSVYAMLLGGAGATTRPSMTINA